MGLKKIATMNMGKKSFDFYTIEGFEKNIFVLDNKVGFITIYYRRDWSSHYHQIQRNKKVLTNEKFWTQFVKDFKSKIDFDYIVQEFYDKIDKFESELNQ